MLNERKLTENEIEQRKIALKGLLKNKRALVKKYGADAEKVMYGIATKQAKKKVENMNLDKLKEMIQDALTVKESSPFVLAADAAKDAGKKEFEFPKGSGKMHPVTIKQDIKNEDLDVGHQDDEPGMLKAELARAGKMVQMLYRAIDKYDGQGEVDFPQWWQKKIIQANAMLDSAFDYLDGQESVAKIDAMIDTINEEEDEVKKRLAVDKAVKSTLKDEGGAAGIDPLAKAVKKLGVSKDQLKSMIKKIVGVAKHKHGDYISTPINEKELSKSDEKALKKIEKALKGSSKAHKNQADRISKIVKEKLTKRSKVDDFVDDFKKSDAKQFKGKSAEKKRKMAVAAYLSKQNEK